MARSRHKHVLRPPHRRLVRLGLAASAVLALGAPAAAIAWPDGETPAASPVAPTKSDPARTSAVSMRVATPSGTEDLVELTASPAAPTRHRSSIKVRTSPSGRARPVELPAPEELTATGRTAGRWAEVVVDHRRVWVAKETLAGATDTGTPRRTGEAAESSTGQTRSPSPTPTSTKTRRTPSSPQPAAPTSTAPATSTAAADPVGTSAAATDPAGDTSTSALPQEPATGGAADPATDPTQPMPEPTEPAEPGPTLPAETCTPDPAVTGQGLALGPEDCLPLP